MTAPKANRRLIRISPQSFAVGFRLADASRLRTLREDLLPLGRLRSIVGSFLRSLLGQRNLPARHEFSIELRMWQHCYSMAF